MQDFFNNAWQVVLELAPWLLLGSAIAGILHTMLPAEFLKKHLNGRWGVLKAIMVGVPMPLCSCGVIPTGLGLKNQGASDGATVGFLISTPQTGVDSILVSGIFLGWPFAIFKVFSAALTGLVGGVLTDAVSAAEEEDLTNASTQGQKVEHKKTWRDGVDHGVEMIESIWGWLAVGILLSAVLTTFVPTNVFGDFAAYGSVLAMLAILAVSVPLYVCATASVPIAAALVAGGLPTGTALVFLMAGPATNIATIGAIYRTLGLKKMLVYLLTIIVGSVALGLTFDFVVDTTAATQAISHTHENGAWWQLVSAIILMLALIKFAVDDLRAWLQRRKKASSHSLKIEVSVEGLTCQGCANKLQRTITQTEGVETAVVSLDPGGIVVHGSIDELSLRQAIDATEFRAV